MTYEGREELEEYQRLRQFVTEENAKHREAMRELMVRCSELEKKFALNRESIHMPSPRWRSNKQHLVASCPHCGGKIQ